MEVSQADLRIGDRNLDFSTVFIKKEVQIKNEILEASSPDVEHLAAESDSYCSIEIKEHPLQEECEEEHENDNENENENCTRILRNFNSLDPNLNAIQQHNDGSNIILADSLYVSPLDSESINGEIQKRESFGSSDEQQINYNIPTVSIPSEFLESLNLNIKKETGSSDEAYATEWLCDVDDPGLKLKISKGIKVERVEIPSDIEATITPVRRRSPRSESFKGNESKITGTEKPKRRVRRKSEPRQDYRERLRRKAECMREKRKKLYEEESEEQRQERLAREAAKKREMRMYYETPEQKRKRLDADAARKREYRMYNESPEERRKRQDREAEKRRLKRLSMYANETPEQRRERLNKESAKRREQRLNQYAKETDEERKERLKRDAIRAREMRFTRSAIETEEERRESFEELSNAQMKEDTDSPVSGHYLSNWMLWFQNTLTQPVQSTDEAVEPQASSKE
ncbi:stress response protein NST1-like isoform X2 [Belonocnema kinseyi]|uniref:stress response protein NST1-like isoform X2 n=1 Tax=Belonocnema kinseyi TaxID=2817044 RepID=UPI00143D5EA4|nr:stress response protein NST1-like isoform X2 [Belonocnema kinseyi]